MSAPAVATISSSQEKIARQDETSRLRIDVIVRPEDELHGGGDGDGSVGGIGSGSVSGGGSMFGLAVTTFRRAAARRASYRTARRTSSRINLFMFCCFMI